MLLETINTLHEHTSCFTEVKTTKVENIKINVVGSLTHGLRVFDATAVTSTVTSYSLSELTSNTE
jgi:hypothetical protein